MNELNEFRKPYEYDDEKGVTGNLMVFFVMILTFELLLGLITLIQGYLVLRPIPWMSVAFFGVGCVNLLLMLLTCVMLHKIPKYAIQIAKIYLLLRAIYLSIACLVIYDAVSKDTLILQRFTSKFNLVLSYVGIPFIYILGFSFGWFWYFKKSKKIKEYQETANKRYNNNNQPDGGIEQ